MLASSPYLNRAEQQAVMESIDHKRPAILPPRPKVLDRMEVIGDRLLAAKFDFVDICLFLCRQSDI